MTHTCPECSGTRVYAKVVPNTKKYGGVEYLSTPPTKTLWYPCATCKGSGRVRCLNCADTGYIEDYDHATGEYECLYPCDCEAGKREERYAAAVAATDAHHYADTRAGAV